MTTGDGRVEKRAGCDWNCGVWCGLFLLAAGVAWLGKKAGWFPPEASFFWPIAVIAIGAWLLLGTVLRGRSS
jgi:hypothetical protein